MAAAIQEKTQYKTMVDPSEEAAPQLLGWKRPRHAYVLLEIPQRNIIRDGEFDLTRGLTTLNAESRAEVMHLVDIYLRKGGRILDYGNFPKLTSPDPERSKKARLYGGDSGKEPWAPLEAYCRQKMRDSVDFQEKTASLQNENDALRAKLAALEAKKAGKAEEK